jgi:hypothetical protein
MLNTYTRLVCNTYPWSDVSTIRQKLYRFVRNISHSKKNWWRSPDRPARSSVAILTELPDALKQMYILCNIFSRQPPSGPSPLFWGSSITIRHTTLGRTPLDDWSALWTCIIFSTVIPPLTKLIRSGITFVSGNLRYPKHTYRRKR